MPGNISYSNIFTLNINIDFVLKIKKLDLTFVLSVGLATETIQFINYFIYESIWTNFHDKRLRRRIEGAREVDMKIDFDSIKDISYECSQTNTFISEYYDSILNFFDNLLQNKYLAEIHDVVLRDKTYFELKHQHRSFK